MSEKNEGNDDKPEAQDTKPEAQDAEDPRVAARKRLNEFGLPTSDSKGDHLSETIGDAARSKMNQFGTPQPEALTPDRAAKVKQLNELGQPADAGKSKSSEQLNQLGEPPSQDAGQQSDTGGVHTFDTIDNESRPGRKPERERPDEMAEVDVSEIEGDYEWTDDEDARDAIDEMLNSEDPGDRNAVLNGYAQYWQYKEGLTEQDRGRYLRALEIFKRQKTRSLQANLERVPVQETAAGRYKPAKGYEQVAGFAKRFFNNRMRVRVTR